MNLKYLFAALVIVATLGSEVPSAFADPLLTSWETNNSFQYARVYQTTSARTSGTSVTTWTNQPLPVYSDVQMILSSASWVYVEYSGLASHVMGPWLNPQGQVFQFWPTNQSGIRRFPRNPSVPAGNKSSTSGGYSGLFVNGVAIFNALDGQAWDGSQIQGSAVHTSTNYFWHRNAPVAESFNFDGANGHQPPSAVYHTHQNPLALRYQLGDHITYNSSTKLYSESTNAVTAHSPIIGWAHDGYPIYGPYGYSVTNDAGSTVRRMVSGYAKRDGTGGTDNLSTNLFIIPAWYARFRQKLGTTYSTTATTSRASINGTYPLGTFAEDWAYLGDCGKVKGTDFDLDEYNGRYCVTPEYPSGTYAYFTTIDSSGSSVYPYVFAYEFYGSATGGSVNNISETVSTNFIGGPDKSITLNTPTVNETTVTLVWNTVEGGTYKVESSPNQSTWTDKVTNVVGTSTSVQTNFTGSNGIGYARVSRTALASYDSAITGTVNSAQTATQSYTISALSIANHPQSQIVNAGATVTFNVSAGGVAPFSYQWLFNSNTIAGATNNSYSITNAQPLNAGSYAVTITNAYGSITSSNATLSFNTAPSISAQPQPLSVHTGDNATFTVTASGTAPLAYQWRFNTTNISGATSSRFTRVGVTNNDFGNYSVVVTNVAGSVTSSDAALTLLPTDSSGSAISIDFTGGAAGVYPASMAASESAGVVPATNWNSAATGGTKVGTFSNLVDNLGATLSASVSWNAPGCWYQPITESAGNYRMMKGYLDETPTVTVSSLPPSFQASGYDVIVYCDGDAGTTSHVRVGQYKIGATSIYAADSTYVFSGTFIQANGTNDQGLATSAGNYVRFTNQTSSSFVLYSIGGYTQDGLARAPINAIQIIKSTNGMPSVVANPSDKTACAFSSVSFTASGSGSPAPSIQWQSQPSGGSFANISGATNVMLTFTAAVADNGTQYRAVFSNAVGTVTSSAATLTVNSLPTATITADSSVLANSTGNIASGPVSMTSYGWTITGGTITSATNIQNVTYTAGTSGSIGLFLTVGNSSGCTAVGSTSVTITTPVVVNNFDPRTNSWFTTYSGKYARVYTNDASKTSGNAVSTWSNGSQNQSLPAYCGVQEVYSSSNWVYLRTTGLPSHTMGPWYLNSGHTQIFPNWPLNIKTLYRIPRTPEVPGTKTLNGTGSIGYFVDGVSMFNSWDSYFWSGSAEANNGTGYWNRDAYVNEGTTLDPGYAHQENTGTHHYHASPIALRYLMNDHVDYNAATKTYSESAAAPTKHSPILAWVKDGYPLYGPYGYSSALDTNSGIRRMISGYVLRNGQNGTTNLTTAGRSIIPQWAARIFNVSSNQSGPSVSTTYPLGRYMEDNDYLGDRGYTQGVDFDLDEYNGRYCVTPEFPNGTYAYFVSISSNGTPVFPYNIGRAFYGNPTGSSVSMISETVVTNFLGGTNLTSQMTSATVGANTVTLVWNAVEGGTYRVDASSTLTNWIAKSTNVAQGITLQTNINRTATAEFYRTARTAIASFDSAGTTTFGSSSVAPGGSAIRGSAVNVTITLPTNPPQPPANAPLSGVILGGTITGTGNSYQTQGTVISTFTIPANATTGVQNIVVTFSVGATYTLTNSFTIY